MSQYKGSHSLTDIWTGFGQLLEEIRSVVKGKDEELKLVKDSLAKMETFYKLQIHGAHLSEMETFYKERLNEARSALKEKEEELQSFKDRVAKEVTPSIETGDTESMNNPVSKTKLTEMYEELRLHQWPKIKDYLKSKDRNLEDVKAYIQNRFKAAADQMETKKQQINEVFRLIESSSGPTRQKVEELRQSAIQSLQLAVYHSRTDVKPAVTQHEGQDPQDVMKNFGHECYWLGCLMDLNNPPLQPDLENHSPGMDAWDIFPQEISAVSAV